MSILCPPYIQIRREFQSRHSDKHREASRLTLPMIDTLNKPAFQLHQGFHSLEHVEGILYHRTVYKPTGTAMVSTLSCLGNDKSILSPPIWERNKKLIPLSLWLQSAISRQNGRLSFYEISIYRHYRVGNRQSCKFYDHHIMSWCKLPLATCIGIRLSARSGHDLTRQKLPEGCITMPKGESVCPICPMANLLFANHILGIHGKPPSHCLPVQP